MSVTEHRVKTQQVSRRRDQMSFLEYKTSIKYLSSVQETRNKNKDTWSRSCTLRGFELVSRKRNGSKSVETATIRRLVWILLEVHLSGLFVFCCSIIFALVYGVSEHKQNSSGSTTFWSFCILLFKHICSRVRAKWTQAEFFWKYSFLGFLYSVVQAYLFSCTD